MVRVHQLRLSLLRRTRGKTKLIPQTKAHLKIFPGIKVKIHTEIKSVRVRDEPIVQIMLRIHCVTLTMSLLSLN